MVKSDLKSAFKYQIHDSGAPEACVMKTDPYKLFKANISNAETQHLPFTTQQKKQGICIHPINALMQYQV